MVAKLQSDGLQTSRAPNPTNSNQPRSKQPSVSRPFLYIRIYVLSSRDSTLSLVPLFCLFESTEFWTEKFRNYSHEYDSEFCIFSVSSPHFCSVYIRWHWIHIMHHRSIILFFHSRGEKSAARHERFDYGNVPWFPNQDLAVHHFLVSTTSPSPHSVLLLRYLLSVLSPFSQNSNLPDSVYGGFNAIPLYEKTRKSR